MLLFWSDFFNWCFKWLLVLASKSFDFSMHNIMQSSSVKRKGGVSLHTKWPPSFLRAKTLAKIELMLRRSHVCRTFLYGRVHSHQVKTSCSPWSILINRERWGEVRRKWVLGIDWQPFIDRSHSAGTQRWREQGKQGGRAFLKGPFPLRAKVVLQKTLGGLEKTDVLQTWSMFQHANVLDLTEWNENLSMSEMRHPSLRLFPSFWDKNISWISKCEGQTVTWNEKLSIAGLQKHAVYHHIIFLNMAGKQAPLVLMCQDSSLWACSSEPK